MTIEQLNIAQRLLTCYMVNGENLQLLVLQDERCAIVRDDVLPALRLSVSGAALALGVSR